MRELGDVPQFRNAVTKILPYLAANGGFEDIWRQIGES